MTTKQITLYASIAVGTLLLILGIRFIFKKDELDEELPPPPKTVAPDKQAPKIVGSEVLDVPESPVKPSSKVGSLGTRGRTGGR